MSGRLPELVLGADVRVVADQHGHALGVSAARRQVQRGVPAVGAAVDVPALCDEEVQSVRLGVGHSHVQGSVAEDPVMAVQLETQGLAVQAVHVFLHVP